MSSYSSSFFTGEDSTVSLPQFGKPLRSLFLLEDGPGMFGHFVFAKTLPTSFHEPWVLWDSAERGDGGEGASPP